MALLEVRNLTKNFGGLTAVNRLDFSIEENQILGLIGPNGAGKTTVLNLISGFIPPTSGHILFHDRELVGFKPDAIARRGIIRTFQQNNLFGNYTVFENLLMGLHLHARIPFWGEVFGVRKTKTRLGNLEREATEIMELLGLEGFGHHPAGNIPHGFKRLLGIGIALGGKPRLLLLDEPFTGMTESETEEIMVKINAIRGKGITILLVEHNMRAVMAMCDHLLVLNFGSKLAEGSCDEIRLNKEVIEAYLGSEEDVL